MQNIVAKLYEENTLSNSVNNIVFFISFEKVMDSVSKQYYANSTFIVPKFVEIFSLWGYRNEFPGVIWKANTYSHQIYQYEDG